MRSSIGSIWGGARVHRQPAPLPADEDEIVERLLGNPPPDRGGGQFLRRQQREIVAELHATACRVEAGRECR